MQIHFANYSFRWGRGKNGNQRDNTDRKEYRRRENRLVRNEKYGHLTEKTGGGKH